MRSATLLAALGVLGTATRGFAADLHLAYDKPATQWTEALPVGNGRIGAMVFGGTEDEHLQINEATLWGGGPHAYADPAARASLDEIRRLIFAGRVTEAEQLSAKMMGEPKLLMPYQPFCDLRLNFPHHAGASGYRRELNLDEAVASVSYQVGETTFRREVFASYPDQILIVRLSADKQGQVSFSAAIDSQQPAARSITLNADTLEFTGRIEARTVPNSTWVGSWGRPGMSYAAFLKILPEGGSVRSVDGHLEVTGADAVTLLFSNATSFRNYRDIGGDPVALAREHLRHASQASFQQLRRRHIEDYQALFSRVRLTLGAGIAEQTTDQRLTRFASNDDPKFLELYFAFGRYLLIAASRPGGQPANLQGIWNQELLPPWGSKWTTNINLQMNYWQADGGDLWETEDPLWRLIADLQVSGADSARKLYGANGWVLHHNTDLWRATAPVDGPWGLWPMGAVWLANQMWDHYQFSQNLSFLLERGYPAMKQAARFVQDFLVEAPAGTRFAHRLVTNPSTSPENEYLLNGQHEHLTYAATMDLELIRELIENCRKAAEILAVDSAFSAQLEELERRLPPLQIGQRGQLQEWIEDYPEAEPAHRHVSHLYSLYPGHDISLQATPDLAAAARKTLELRGDGGTGWSRVWRVALWARLHDAARAYENLKLLITGSTLPNLFDLCPPFQIDGNLGAPAAMMEMLVQSSSEEITLLPALPRQWPAGRLRGVRVRGGAKVDLQWTDGVLSSISLQADHPASYVVRYGGRSVQVSLTPGKTLSLDGALTERGV
jgi:alpha-L-fucosidase 2